MLTFNPETHTYHNDGQRVPGVSEVIDSAGLSDFSNVPTDRLDYAKALGTSVHLTLELYDKDDLADCPAIVEPYLEGYKQFLKDKKPEILEIEKMYLGEHMYNKEKKYAGTIDRVYKIGDEIYIADIKSGGQYKSTRIQTIAYAHAYGCATGNLATKRMVIYLNKEGGYKITEHTDRNDAVIFFSCLHLFYWKNPKFNK